MSTTPAGSDRWKNLNFAPPSADATEPESPVLVDYRNDGQIAVITLNRPLADNAITPTPPEVIRSYPHARTRTHSHPASPKPPQRTP